MCADMGFGSFVCLAAVQARVAVAIAGSDDFTRKFASKEYSCSSFRGQSGTHLLNNT